MDSFFASLNDSQRQEAAARIVCAYMHQKFKKAEMDWSKKGKGCAFSSLDLDGKIMHFGCDMYAGSTYRKAWDDEGNWQFPNVQMPRVSYELDYDFQIIIDPEMNGCIVAPRDKLYKLNYNAYAANAEDCVKIKF